jgi:hypothetical protein
MQGNVTKQADWLQLLDLLLELLLMTVGAASAKWL